MAIGYGGQDDALNTSTSETITVPVPAGVAAGDWMVAHITVGVAAAAALSAPAGWTQLGATREDGNLTTAVYTKYATASEPANYTWTHNGVFARNSGRILAYTGTDPTDAVADWSVVGTTTSTTSIATGAVDVPAGGWLLALPADRRNAPTVAQSWSTDVGTDITRGQVSGATGSGFQVSSAGIDSAGDAEGTGVTRTVTASEVWGQVAVWVIAIAPAPPPPPTFPFADLATHLELLVGGTWTEVTPQALTQDPITITRGRANEAGHAAPAMLLATIRDPSGMWAPRSPMSPLYGLIGRNTPIRARVGDEPRYAYLPGVNGHYLSTPDTAALDITGEIDVRVDITPDTWRPTGRQTILASKWGDTSTESWVVFLRPTGHLRFLWTSTGSNTDRRASDSTAPVPADARRLAVRVVLTTDNGAGEREYRFYTAPTIDGPWTQLGATKLASGTEPLFGGTAPVEVGTVNGGRGDWFTDARGFHGYAHAFQVRNGDDGPVVADPDIEAVAEGATSWTGAAGLVWTAHGDARILRPSRYHGEVASWPQRWHVSGHNLTVPIQAGGVRRRLSQGASPILSTLRREMTATPPPSLVQYWPMEDAGGEFASAFPSGAPLRITSPEAPNFATDSTFVGSAPLPTFDQARVVGAVPGYTTTGQTQARMLLKMPATPPSAARRLVMLATTGTAARWDLWYSTTSGGLLAISAYDRDGVRVLEEVSSSLFVAGIAQRVSIELEESGGNVTWRIVALQQGAPTGAFRQGTLNGYTAGRVQSVVVGDDRGLGNTVIGHLTINSEITSIFDLVDQFNAYAGEPAGARIARLGRENNVPVTVLGELADTTPMGPQRVATLADLWQDAADADGGILHDARDELGVEYRTRASLYNQPAAVTLDYPTPGEVPPPLTPTEDDQGTRNDVTVSRDGGSSARFVLEDGPLSVQPPPAGVGRYDESVRLNVAADDQLLDLAAWRVRVGTVDEPRYPKIPMWLHTAPQKIDAAKTMDVGDRLLITNPPAWLPPGAIDQIVQGYKETLLPRRWEFVLNAGPASPYDVAAVDDDELGRVDTDGSVLVEAVDETATGLLVASTAGPRWTTDPAEVPFGVTLGGEDVEVTAVGDGVVDLFNRTVANGWGSTPDGRPWLVSDTAADYSVASGVAAVSIGALNTGRVAHFDLGAGALDVEATLRTSVMPTGSLLNYSLLGLVQDAAAWYALRVRLHEDGHVDAAIEVTPGFVVLAGPETIPGVTVTAGAWLRARLRVQAGRLDGKVWADGAAEPRDWQITASDSTYSSGGAGVRSYLPPGSTLPLPVAFEWGEVLVHNPQAMTVTRSTNGIVKGHQAGADVRLTQPAHIAL